MLPIIWSVLCAIMVLRIFLGVDFTLVNVVLSAYKPVQTITYDDSPDKEITHSEGETRFQSINNEADTEPSQSEEYFRATDSLIIDEDKSDAVLPQSKKLARFTTDYDNRNQPGN